jgi:RHS repeat-associated protein
LSRELAIADSGGQLQGALIGPQYDAGLWNSSGLTSRAQSFNPRRWSTPGGIDTISTFRSRQYDPATGKWLQEDPMGVAGGVNLYGYNGNDPNRFSDPFGLVAEYPACGGLGPDPAMLGRITEAAPPNRQQAIAKMASKSCRRL